MVNTLGSGLDLPRQQDASSRTTSSCVGCRIDQVYRALSEQYSETRLKVYINGDGADVYEDTYKCIAMMDDGTLSATLILVGIRLGIDRITPVYWDSLKAVLRLPQSMGIAG